MPRIRSRIVIRLWCIIMALVFLSIAFTWVGQIFLFEQNYVQSAMEQVQGSLTPLMEELRTEDLAHNEDLLSQLSLATSGKMMLLNGEGELIRLYSYGHPIDYEDDSFVWHTIQYGDAYQRLLRGEQYQKVHRFEGKSTYEIGMRVLYDGQDAYVVLTHMLTEVNTVLSINRSQLVVLSIMLTLVAAVLAAILSRQFVKPIHIVKSAVDELTKGNLSSAPGLKRKDELGELSDSVEELGIALQRVDVLRKEVIANVSHELRSPLSLIAGYAEMVRDINWKDDAKREEDLNLILSEARRMSEMVSDIMDYSQFQAGYVHLNKDWYNICEIAESEISHCEQGAHEHGIRIDLSCEQPEVSACVDAIKISQVLRNLLYNAINHTADGGRIQVRVENHKDAFRVAVANPGDPIPDEEREIIWERYQRSQHQAGRKQGTGIGLSIVRTILVSHGFRCGVDCKDGMTVFWFYGPKA